MQAAIDNPLALAKCSSRMASKSTLLLAMTKMLKSLFFSQSKSAYGGSQNQAMNPCMFGSSAL